eukprot:m.91844 g.91844  ORF g.91844 m.91844 type:complete len:762 (-) comp8880_c2_seq1:298-2583(-)
MSELMKQFQAEASELKNMNAEEAKEYALRKLLTTFLAMKRGDVHDKSLAALARYTKDRGSETGTESVPHYDPSTLTFVCPPEAGIDSHRVVRVAVAGNTSVGKSSLLNNMLRLTGNAKLKTGRDRTTTDIARIGALELTGEDHGRVVFIDAPGVELMVGDNVFFALETVYNSDIVLCLYQSTPVEVKDFVIMAEVMQKQVFFVHTKLDTDYNEKGDDDDDEDDVLAGRGRKKASSKGNNEANDEDDDDDDDKRKKVDPQFAPRGKYFVHDVRGQESASDSKNSKHKPTRSERTERWGHDMFSKSNSDETSESKNRGSKGKGSRRDKSAPSKSSSGRHVSSQKPRKDNESSDGPVTITLTSSSTVVTVESREEAIKPLKSFPSTSTRGRGSSRGRGGGRGRGRGRGRGNPTQPSNTFAEFPSLSTTTPTTTTSTSVTSTSASISANGKYERAVQAATSRGRGRGSGSGSGRGRGRGRPASDYSQQPFYLQPAQNENGKESSSTQHAHSSLSADKPLSNSQQTISTLTASPSKENADQKTPAEAKSVRVTSMNESSKSSSMTFSSVLKQSKQKKQFQPQQQQQPQQQPQQQQPQQQQLMRNGSSSSSSHGSSPQHSPQLSPQPPMVRTISQRSNINRPAPLPQVPEPFPSISKAIASKSTASSQPRPQPQPQPQPHDMFSAAITPVSGLPMSSLPSFPDSVIDRFFKDIGDGKDEESSNNSSKDATTTVSSTKNDITILPHTPTRAGSLDNHETFSDTVISAA